MAAQKESAQKESDASAPSEQELKEEEELQLALALSLSETRTTEPVEPAKVSFPDLRQFEEPQPSSSSLAPQQYIPTTQKNQGEPKNQVHEFDQELFKFVAEVQSTSEVFMNRVNSSKLRNRPIANDSAIQSLFLKQTNMHARLLEYIKIHDEERSIYEGLQDKLSQIADARAALDDLREEHREKLRQAAAEAERQRQSQLALRLEMMRQKKSQMMQYQREVALQRIQAQEMMLRQPQEFPGSPSNAHQQQVPQQHTQTGLQQHSQPPPPPLPPTTTQPELQPPPIYQSQNSSIIQQTPIVQHQQTPFVHHNTMQQHSQSDQRFTPQYPNGQQQVQQSASSVIKTEEEAPLIWFDD